MRLLVSDRTLHSRQQHGEKALGHDALPIRREDSSPNGDSKGMRNLQILDIRQHSRKPGAYLPTVQDFV